MPPFEALAALNDWLEQRCRELWRQTAHGSEPGTIADVWAQEVESLMPMGRPFDGFVEHTKRVFSTCLIHLERNRYSVPASFANRPVSLRVYPERLAAVELALEDGVPSKTHILNRLHRLIDSRPRPPRPRQRKLQWQTLHPQMARRPGIRTHQGRPEMAAKSRLTTTDTLACADITLHADVDERTVATGAAYAKGIAPGCALTVGHAITPKDPLFSPDVNVDSDAVATAMHAAMGAPHQALLAAMQAVLDPHGIAFLNEPSTISAKTPGALPKLKGRLAGGASAAEDFLLEYLDGKPGAVQIDATE